MYASPLPVSKKQVEILELYLMFAEKALCDGASFSLEDVDPRGGLGPFSSTAA
jgi:hypothetical protein